MSLGVSCLRGADRYTPGVAPREKPVSEWAKRVGARFNTAMKDAGWSQKRYERETSIAASTVGDLINAKRNVTLGTFEQLCRAAGLDPDEVIVGRSYLVHTPRSDDHSAEALARQSQERSTMDEKTAMQWDVIRLATAVQPEDAAEAFDALSKVYARRGLHQGGASDTGG